MCSFVLKIQNTLSNLASFEKQTIFKYVLFAILFLEADHKVTYATLLLASKRNLTLQKAICHSLFKNLWNIQILGKMLAKEIIQVNFLFQVWDEYLSDHEDFLYNVPFILHLETNSLSLFSKIRYLLSVYDRYILHSLYWIVSAQLNALIQCYVDVKMLETVTANWWLFACKSFFVRRISF